MRRPCELPSLPRFLGCRIKNNWPPLIFMRMSLQDHQTDAIEARNVELAAEHGIHMNKTPIKTRSLVFFLVPHFTMLPFSAAIETLRIANRMLGYSAYTWRLASVDGQKVYSSSGIGIEVNTSLADERRYLSGENRPNMVTPTPGSFLRAWPVRRSQRINLSRSSGGRR